MYLNSEIGIILNLHVNDTNDFYHLGLGETIAGIALEDSDNSDSTATKAFLQMQSKGKVLSPRLVCSLSLFMFFLYRKIRDLL